MKTNPGIWDTLTLQDLIEIHWLISLKSPFNRFEIPYYIDFFDFEDFEN